jgi:hypothetical protein
VTRALDIAASLARTMKDALPGALGEQNIGPVDLDIRAASFIIETPVGRFRVEVIELNGEPPVTRRD